MDININTKIIMTMEEQYIIEDVKKFITGGKAEFTVQNVVSNNHLTFSISKDKVKPHFYVNVCYSYVQYIYIGLLVINDGKYSFIKSKRLQDSKEDSTSVKVIEYMIKYYLNSDDGHNNLAFYHHGRCCKCGRPLTTPESIQKGIGPFCDSL